MYSALHHLPTLFWKRRPVQLTYFVTRRCNARCPYCFYRESNDTLADDGDELTLEEITRVARSLGRLLWLAFSGGEIYLRKDLVEISRVFYATNKPTIMLYPTNGQMPALIRDKTEQILAALRKILKDLQQCACAAGGFDPRRVFSVVERKVKSVFIHAFQDADTFDLARARRCCNAYPQPDGRLLPGLGHLLHHDDPELMIELVCGFPSV